MIYRKNKVLHFFIFVLVYLSSVGFYNPFGIIQPQVIKFLTYIVILGGLVVALYEDKRINSNIPIYSYVGLLVGILISAIMASIFHEQSFSVSFISILPYFLGYFYFYILLKLRIPSDMIIKGIIVFVCISMIIYVINFVTFPNIIFGASKDEYDMSRGMARLGVMSIELVVLIFFYSINKYQLSKLGIWKVLIVFTGILIILSLTRQIIAYSFVIGGFMLLSRKSLFSKTLIAASIIFVVYIVVPNIPVFNTMINLTESQIDNNKYEEDKRIQAWRYYTIEYQTNLVTPVLGNGVPALGKSLWARQFEQKTDTNLCFAADVGWAGFYWYFGFVATACLLIILLKAALKKKGRDEIYLTSWMWFIILSSITSGPILYYYQIINVSVVLYLIYRKRIPNKILIK